MDNNRKNEEFDFSYVAPDSEEKRWIEDIRRQYLPEARGSKIAEIKSLHKKARRLAKFTAAVMGIVGCLVLGTGMSLTLVFEKMAAGIVVGLLGMLVIFLTYPVHQFLIEWGKKLYGDKILKLTDEVSPRDVSEDSENSVE